MWHNCLHEINFSCNFRHEKLESSRSSERQILDSLLSHDRAVKQKRSLVLHFYITLLPPPCLYQIPALKYWTPTFLCLHYFHKRAGWLTCILRFFFPFSKKKFEWFDQLLKHCFLNTQKTKKNKGKSKNKIK